MKEEVIFEKFGFDMHENSNIGWGKSIMSNFAQLIEPKDSSGYTAFNQTFFNCKLTFLLMLIKMIQLWACIAESCETLFTSSADKYFFNFLMGMKLHSLLTYNGGGYLMYLLISLIIIWIFVIGIILLRIDQGLNNYLKYLLINFLRLFNWVLVLPCIDSTSKLIFTSLISDSAVTAQANYYFAGFALAGCLVIRFTFSIFASDAFLFHTSNDTDYKLLDSSNGAAEILFEVVIILMNSSGIFSFQVLIYFYAILFFAHTNSSLNYRTKIKIARFSMFCDSSLAMISIILILSYNFNISYICLSLASSLVILFFWSDTYIRSMNEGLVSNFRMSRLTSIDELFMVLQYFILKMNSLSEPITIAEIQGYITMMNEEIYEALQFKTEKTHLPLTNEWRSTSAMETGDNVYLKNFIVFIMEYHSKTKDCDDFNLYINLSFYLLKYLDQYPKAIYYMIKAKHRIFSLQESFAYFRMEQLMKQEVLKKVALNSSNTQLELAFIDFSELFLYQIKKKKFEYNFNYFMSLHHLFWDLIKCNSSSSSLKSERKSELNLKVLTMDFSQIDSNKGFYNINRLIASRHKVLIKLYFEMKMINNAWTELWSIYEVFLNSIEYDLEFLNILNNHVLDFEQNIKKGTGKVPFTQLYSNNNSVSIVISSDTICPGRIEYISQNSSKVFGFKHTELIYMPIEMVMPDIIGSRHRGYMNLYLKTGEKTLIDRTVRSFALTKNRSLFECNVSAKILPCFKSLVYCGIVQRKLSTSNFIILDENLRVCNVSPQLCSIIDMNESIFSTENINLLFMSKDILKLSIVEYNRLYLKQRESGKPQAAPNPNKDTTRFKSISVYKKPSNKDSSNCFSYGTRKKPSNLISSKSILYSLNNSVNLNFEIKSQTFKESLKLELDTHLLRRAFHRVFSKGLINIKFNIHNMLRKSNNISKSPIEASSASKMAVCNFDLGIDQVSNSQETLYFLKDEIKQQFTAFDKLLSLCKFGTLVESFETLFRDNETQIFSFNDLKRKRGEHLQFKFESRLSSVTMMDGFKMYVIQISEDSYNIFANSEFPTCQNQEEVFKPKIEKTLQYSSNIAGEEENFKLKKFMRSETFKAEKELLSTHSNIFKYDFNINIYNSAQDIHSSSSQVLNKQVKYSRITSKINNLFKKFDRSKSWLYFLLIFNGLIFIAIISISFSQYFEYQNTVLSCNEMYEISIKVLYNYLNAHSAFLLTKLAYDMDIRKSAKNLSSNSKYDQVYVSDQLFFKFGYSNQDDYFIEMKKLVIEKVTASFTNLKELEDYSLSSSNKCTTPLYYYTKQISTELQLKLSEIYSLESINFDFTESSDRLDYLTDQVESNELLLHSLYNQLSYFEIIVNNPKYVLGLYDQSKDFDTNYLDAEVSKLLNFTNTVFISSYSQDIAEFLRSYPIINNQQTYFLILTLALIGIVWLINFIIYFKFTHFLDENLENRKKIIRRIDESTAKDIKMSVIRSISTLKYYQESQDSTTITYDIMQGQDCDRHHENSSKNNQSKLNKSVNTSKLNLRIINKMKDKSTNDDLLLVSLNVMLKYKVPIQENLKQHYFNKVDLKIFIFLLLFSLIYALIRILISDISTLYSSISDFLAITSGLKIDLSKAFYFLLQNQIPTVSLTSQNISFLFNNTINFEVELRKFKGIDTLYSNSSDFNNNFYVFPICDSINVLYKGCETDYRGTEFVSSRETLINLIRFLYDNGLTHHEERLNTVSDSVMFIFDTFLTDFSENRLLSRFKVSLESDALSNYCLFIFLLFMIVGASLHQLQLSRKQLNLTFENIGNVLKLIPFKNKNDIEVIDRYLSLAEVNLS